MDAQGRSHPRPLGGAPHHFGGRGYETAGARFQEGKPMRATGGATPATAWRRNGLSRGARPRGRNWFAARETTRRQSASGDTGTATQQGKALEGEAPSGKPVDRPPRGGTARRQHGEPHARQRDATSPRSSLEEQPVKVVRNHGGGPRSALGSAGPKPTACGERERTPGVMSIEGRFFGKPYGRRSTRVEPSSARGVLDSETHMAAAGGRHLGDRRATPAPCDSDVTRHAREAS